MGHYDGKEFEKILLEAQANMMKGIPSLEVEENQALPPTATAEPAEPADTPKPVESPTGTHLTQRSYSAFWGLSLSCSVLYCGFLCM